MSDPEADFSRLIELAGGVGLYEHRCLIYETKQQQLAAAIPFLKASLERRERCLYIADDNNASTVLDALGESGIDVDECLRSGLLILTPKHETYLKSGSFDPDLFLGFLSGLIHAGGGEFPGVRTILGEMTWALSEATPGKLIEYEAKLNHFVRNHEVRILCQYNRQRFRAEVILDVLRTHPVVVYGGIVSANPYYVPPEDFLRPDRASQEVERLLNNILTAQRALAQLRASEARLKDAQRIAKLGSWELDIATNTILSWSDQLFEIFAITQQELGGDYEAFLSRVHPSDREAVKAAQNAALTGQARINVEYRIVLPDGSVKYIHELGDVVRDAQGRPRRLSGTALDITERKRAEEALREANANLERRVQGRTEELAIAKERAEVADRTKSAFLAMMSHELRTPMNSIIGFTGILLKELAGPLNQEQAKQLGMVRESARHLLALINDILDISKIEAGELEIRLEAFDLRALVERAIGTVRPLAAKKGLTLQWEVPPLPDRIISDPRRVEQVLLNLLDNAVKFTDQGEVRLLAEIVPALAVSETTPQPWARFRVSDTGIGIRPEDLATLFQPFRQVESGLTRHQQGTGLGLFICRRLAELLGGEVRAESRFGSGSMFTFLFPLNQENRHP